MFILENKIESGVFVYESDAGPSLGMVIFKQEFYTQLPEPKEFYVAWLFDDSRTSQKWLGQSYDFFEAMSLFNPAK